LEGRLVSETHYPTPSVQPLLREYVYHPDATTPTAFVESGRLYVMQADVRGAVTHVFDAGGQVVWQAHYSAFGQATLTIDTIRQPFRLTGQQEDVESGLYYNLARYYAPFIGAYLSLDPEWLDPDTYYYAYARQDPYNRHDPMGNIAPLVIAGIIAGGALVGGVISAGVTAYQGGSLRAVGASFVHGALSGAGATAGAMFGGIPGAMLGAAAGGFLGTLAEQAINGDPLCFGCAAEQALVEGLFAGAFGLAGKLIGPSLGRLAGALWRGAGRLASRIGQAMKAGMQRAAQAARRAATRMRDKIKGWQRGTRLANEAERQRIAEIRRKHNISKRKNIANIEGEINGKKVDLEAHSGVESKRGTAESRPHAEQELETHPTKDDVRRGPTTPDQRAYDSEVKALEKILQDTAENPNAQGKIKIVSERPVCDSCREAIEQFRRKRPNIKVEVVEIEHPK
ncbi:MAG: hypothetical protein H7Z72_04400, partial [Bacteroidetes bacterium]|nr:hypothetical protein [Fibrella sp.]